MDGSASPAGEDKTLLLICPVCRADAGDTLGVADAPAGGADDSVVLRCDTCGTIYLSPAFSTGAESHAPERVPDGRRRFVRRFARGLPDRARIIAIGQADSMPESGQFDRVLLPWLLESARDPTATVAHAARLLSDAGRVVVITGNAASSCFGIFGGRHWSGYGWPGTRQQLTPEALACLGQSAGLRIVRLASIYDSRPWLDSALRWLRDWGAGKLAVAILTGPWLLPQCLAALLEAIAVIRGRGSLLVAEFGKL